MNTAEDLYPSRKTTEERVISRKDPVVWSVGETTPPIDRKLIERYEREGFLILEDVFTDEEIACFQEELDRLRTDPVIRQRVETITEPDSDEVRSVFAVHRLSPVFERLANDSRIAEIARYVLNDEVYVHQSRLNYKPGFRGREFFWHSDFETWHVEDGMPRMRALSVSITLTDNSEFNGALMLIPGSHWQYITCTGETPKDHYRQSLKNQQVGVPSDRAMRQMVKQGGIFSSRGKAGSVVIFDCNTLHGSNSNISPFPRSNLFFVFNAVSNRVTAPFCDQSPRPDYISARAQIDVVKPQQQRLESRRARPARDAVPA